MKCHFSLLRMDICLIRAKNVTTKSVIELFEMNKRWLSLVRDTTIKYFTNCKNHSSDVGESPKVISWCWSLKVAYSFQILEIEFLTSSDIINGTVLLNYVDVKNDQIHHRYPEMI